jgi:6-methylsalicylic acid synthase
MPAHLRRLAVRERLPGGLWILVRTQGSDTVDITLGTAERGIVGHLTGVRYGAIDTGTRDTAGPGALVHRTAWREWHPTCPQQELRTVVLVRPSHADESALPAALRARGLRCLPATGPEDLSRLRDRCDDASVVVVEPEYPTGEGRITGVAAYQSAWLLLRTARVLAEWPSEGRPRLWALSRGVRESVGSGTLAHSSLWGVARVLAGEQPDLWGGLVDLDDGADGEADDAQDADSLLELLRHGRGEEITAVRARTTTVPRLVPVTPADGPGLTCRPGGTYLVTGGLGVLGREVARWLAERGARRLVLASRSGLPPREAWDDVEDPERAARIDTVRALEAAGVTVRCLELDITHRVQAAKLLSPAELGLPPVTGVVHAAGVLDNRMVTAVDARSLARVMRPKVAGALVLHELFPPGSLEFLALFSSAGPLLGLAGQASYAAANAFLDALARHRRAGGATDTISLSWTSWRGIPNTTASVEAELSARGTAAITPDEAFRSWDHAMRGGTGHVAVLRADPSRSAARTPPLLRELTAERPPATPPRRSWEGLRGDALTDHLVSQVAVLVAEQLRLGRDELDPRRPLADLGVDSVLTQSIRAALEQRFLIGLPVTLLWNHPTVRAIAEHLTDLLDPAGGAERDTGHEISDDGTGRSA